MKDHEIAQLVNQVTKIAKKFHDSQQLRQNISNLLVPVLKTLQREKHLNDRIKVVEFEEINMKDKISEIEFNCKNLAEKVSILESEIFVRRT